MQFRKTLFMLLSCLTVSSCSIVDFFEEVPKSIQQAIKVIDEGINDIRHESASWQNVLQEVAKELPEDISENIRKDAEILVSKSIAEAGVEFRCNTDFLSKRAVESLFLQGILSSCHIDDRRLHPKSRQFFDLVFFFGDILKTLLSSLNQLFHRV